MATRRTKKPASPPKDAAPRAEPKQNETPPPKAVRREPRPTDDAKLTKRPDRAKWVETLDRLANRPFLEGDYLPGPIKGTDVKDRAPKHPDP